MYVYHSEALWQFYSTCGFRFDFSFWIFQNFNRMRKEIKGQSNTSSDEHRQKKIFTLEIFRCTQRPKTKHNTAINELNLVGMWNVPLKQVQFLEAKKKNTNKSKPHRHFSNWKRKRKQKLNSIHLQLKLAKLSDCFLRGDL